MMKFKTGIIILANVSITLMIIMLMIIVLSESAVTTGVFEEGLSLTDDLEISKVKLFLEIFINNLLVFTASILLLGIGTQVAYAINLSFLAVLVYMVYVGTGDLINVLKLFVYHLPFEIVAFWAAILIGYSLLDNILIMRKSVESGRKYFKKNMSRNAFLYGICVVSTLIGALVEVYISGGM